MVRITLMPELPAVMICFSSFLKNFKKVTFDSVQVNSDATFYVAPKYILTIK